MKQVIEDEAATIELDRIIEFYEVDPEGKDWEDSKKRLLSAIMKGRITLDEESGVVIMELVSPIKLQNDDIVKSLEFREPTAGDLKVLDKYKESESMAKTIHLASKITSKSIAIIEKMIGRDLSTMGAITSLFF